MKVIDLFNKIANGEELPYRIKYNERIYEYVEEIKWYLRDDMKCELSNSKKCLNEKVEIIEQEKEIPEKIKSNGKEFYCDNIDSWIDKEKTSAYCEYLMNKYNDLIDYFKSKGEDK